MENASNAGLALHLGGQYAEAEKLYVQAVRTAENTIGTENSNYATVLNNVGQLQFTRGNLNAAEAYYRRALDLYMRLHGPADSAVSSPLTNLGVLKQA